MGSIAALASPATAQTESQLAIARRKAPDGLLEQLADGRAIPLIVRYHDAQVQRQAIAMRDDAGLSIEDATIREFKADQYRLVKESVVASFLPGEVTVLKDYSHLPMNFVRVNDANALFAMLANADVTKVYRNQVRYRMLAQSLPLINQPPVEAAGYDGTGTSVAVLDTGVDYTRPAFGSCTAPGVPSGCKVVIASDFAPDDSSLDDDGHGTHVAGITTGVAPDAGILALDVFRAGFAVDSDIIDAINWSIANKTIHNIVAMNLSLGGGAFPAVCSGSSFDSPFANARAAGIAPVVASGNGAREDRIALPACAPGAVRVGAVYDGNLGPMSWSNCQDSSTDADQVTCFSNSASFLTLLAPGAIIDAAGMIKSGTSQAAPHISGAIAVLQEAGGELTVDDVEAAMTSTGVSITDLRNGHSHPRLDLEAAVDFVSSTEPLRIEIDIRPGSTANKINLKSKGVLPVAILTNVGFDATGIDTDMIEFGPAAAGIAHTRGHFEDVDDDGDEDLLLHFRVQETGISCRDTKAVLTGETLDGTLFEGSDGVNVMHCR